MRSSMRVAMLSKIQCKDALGQPGNEERRDQCFEI